jgi:hypothetical protein
MAVYTTIHAIKQVKQPEKQDSLLKRAGFDDNSLISLVAILDRAGFDYALRCLPAVKGFDEEIRLFAATCVNEVRHLMKDQRSIDALDVSLKYGRSEASDDELNAASNHSFAASRQYQRSIHHNAIAASAAAWLTTCDIDDVIYSLTVATCAAASAAIDRLRSKITHSSEIQFIMADAERKARAKQEEIFRKTLG